MFARKETKDAVEQIKNVAQKQKEEIKAGVPDGYVEVKLDSIGQLMAPKVLHFRNYRLLEAQELRDITEQNEEEVFIRVLNSMVYEDFDCGLLHRQDVIRILLTIHATFWNPVISSFRYVIDESIEGEAKYDRSNMSIADLPVSSLEFKELDKKAVLPIKIKTPAGDEYHLRTEVLADTVLAKQFIAEKYYDEEVRLSSVHQRILKDQPVSLEESEAYKDYIRRKLQDFSMAKRACLLVSKNGNEFQSFDDAFKEAMELDLIFWETLHYFMKDQFDFGINEDVEFNCTVTGKKIVRRFHFRSIDFIPSLEKNRSSKYSISAG